MGRVNKCCKPFNIKNHKKIIKNLVLITKNRAPAFKDFIGDYMCNSCERAIYLGRKPEIPGELSVNECFDFNEPESSNNFIEDDEKKDPSFVCDLVDNKLKIDKVNKLLLEIGEPPIKVKRASNAAECEKVLKSAVSKITNNNSNINNVNNPNDLVLNNFKSAFNDKKSRADKILVLTTLPPDWSIKMIRREFKVSKRMVKTAKKIREERGFASQPKIKKGKTLKNETLQRIQDFYLSDDVSRVMPGMKDYVSVMEDGKKVQKQKRLLLYNIHELHKKFTEVFPDEKIGLTKFQKLRPRECISAGKSGTHNVCVCKIHQNIKLQLNGFKNELKKKERFFQKVQMI